MLGRHVEPLLHIGEAILKYCDPAAKHGFISFHFKHALVVALGVAVEGVQKLGFHIPNGL